MFYQKFLPFLLLLLLVFASCRQKPATPLQQGAPVHESVTGNPCFPGHDTVFPDGDMLRYVYFKKEGWRLVIRIDNLNDTPGFLFNCPVADGMVPSVFKKEPHTIYLKQGNGFTYRNIMSCTAIGERLQLTGYESVITGPEAPDLFVFKAPDAPHQLQLYDRDKEVWYQRVLPAAYQQDTVLYTEVYKDSLLVFFTHGRQCRLVP